MNFFKQLLLLCFFNITAKVLIITPVFNRPDFIELQYSLYKKFLQDQYEMVIFDDSDDHNISKEINEICKNLNIKCLKIPKQIHKQNAGPSEFSSDSINYALQNLGFYHSGIVAIISSDVFLVKDFNIEEYMLEKDIAGLHQNRKHIDYLWDGIIFLRINALPQKNKINFDCGVIDNIIVDSGGFLYYYLKEFKDLKIKYFDQVYFKDYNSDNLVVFRNNKENEPLLLNLNAQGLKQKDFSKEQIDLIQSNTNNIEFFINNTFFHYRSGSNWNKVNINYHSTKTRLVTRFFHEILQPYKSEIKSES